MRRSRIATRTYVEPEKVRPDVTVDCAWLVKPGAPFDSAAARTPDPTASCSATASARRPSVSRKRAFDWASETAATPTSTTKTISNCMASIRPASVHRRRPTSSRHLAVTA